MLPAMGCSSFDKLRMNYDKLWTGPESLTMGILMDSWRRRRTNHEFPNRRL